MNRTSVCLVLLSLAGSAAAQHPSERKRAGASSVATPVIIQQNDGEHLVRRTGPTAGWPYIIKLDRQTGGAEDFFVMSETMAPGQSIPFHKHDNAEELLLLEEGGASIIVGGTSGVAGPRAIVFIPRNTWISATNTSDHDIHLTAVFSRQGYERYMRAISVKPGDSLSPISPTELTRLRTLGHAHYWDTSKGPYPPGVARP